MKKLFSLTLFLLFIGPNTFAKSSGVKLNWKPQNESQEDFLEAVKEGEWDEANELWNQAYGNSSKARTTEGGALRYLILFHNGLEASALEKLSHLSQPRRMSQQMENAWKKAAHKNHNVWKVAEPRWSAQFKQIFDNIYRSQARPYPAYSASSMKSVRKVKSNLRSADYDKEQKAHGRFQMALAQILLGHPAEAIGDLNRLSEKKYNSVSYGRLFLNRGRAFYQMNDFYKALDSYAQVPATSDYWTLAKEEEAWAYIRLKKPAKAIASLKNVTVPVFQNQVGAEPFFLSAYSHLKICDYPGVFKDIKRFKKTFKKRIPALQKLKQRGLNSKLQKALPKLAENDFRPKGLGPFIGYLPQLFHRDIFLKRHLRTWAQFSKETDLAKNILGSNHRWVKRAKSRYTKAYQKLENRLQALATQDLKTIKEMLDKLHVIEAEAIQRIYKQQKIAKDYKMESDKISSSSNTLTFPVSEEVWLDELDSFHVKAKDCPKL